MDTMKGRPLVVLAGWLGSQPKHLRRYEDMYRKIGCTVLTRIAPPYAVVKAVLFQNQTITNNNNSNINNSIHSEDPTIETVELIANDIINNIQLKHNDCSCFFFHAFSNGGCFIWESLRRILYEQQQEKEINNSTTGVVKNKLVGVIFDSAPIAELELINKALEYCNEDEIQDVIRLCGKDVLYERKSPMLLNQIQKRKESYIANLRDDPLQVNQLYLYSNDDPLAPAKFIDTIFDHRIQILGNDHIFRQKWDISKHCGHLLVHPNEYTQAVNKFIKHSEKIELVSKY